MDIPKRTFFRRFSARAAHQTPDEVAISALFQTLVKNAPCILFLKESDRAIFGSNDRYCRLVVLIGCAHWLGLLSSHSNSSLLA